MNNVTTAFQVPESKSVRKLIESALSLFRRYGLRKVSVEEICSTAGVSRMTFYRHFADKDDIAVKALGRHFIERMEAVELILAERIPFEDRLRKIFHLKLEGIKRAGEELTREILSDRESVLGRSLGELFAEQTRRTREIFLSLQQAGEIRRDLHVDLIMHIVEHAWSAFGDERLSKAYDDKTRLYHELFQAIYYGILPPSKNRSRS